MSSFTRFDHELDLRYDRNTGKWSVLASFTYDVGFKGSETKVVVPQGFLTDGASVPRPFWSLIPPFGEHGQAAVLHDWLCENLTIIQNGTPVKISRAKADAIFLEAMEVLGVCPIKRTTMYAAVRAYAVAKGK